MSFNMRTLRVTEDSTQAQLFRIYPTERSRHDAENEALFTRIEAAITATNDLGRLPLWEDYKKLTDYGRPIGDNPKRKMSEVRTKAEFCRFYAWLAEQIAPEAIVEFGAAFGASGMYWLAGLSQIDTGVLYSFEPNPVWHPIAQENFDRVSPKHVLANGTFEDNLDVIEHPVSISLIDAIHTRDFVMAQFDLVRRVSKPGALVLFDDINFSDDMKRCWAEVSEAPDWRGVWQLGGRVGVIELP